MGQNSHVLQLSCLVVVGLCSDLITAVYQLMGPAVYQLMGPAVYQLVGPAVYQLVGPAVYQLVGPAVYQLVGLCSDLITAVYQLINGSEKTQH